MSKLKVISGPARNAEFELTAGGWGIVIGRSEADFTITDPMISRRHAELSFRDGQWMIRDMKSRNGTAVNGNFITGPVHIRHNYEIRLGNSVLLFESDDNPDLARLPDRIKPARTHHEVSNETVPGFDSSLITDKADSLETAGRGAVFRSHGIKNILQALTSGREVMDKAVKAGDIELAVKGWRILSKNIDLVEKLVVDMLRFSKDKQPVLVKSNLNSIIRSGAELLAQRAAENKKTLDIVLDENMQSTRLDPDQIYDVVLNLGMNALDAVKSGSGRVTLSSRFDVENDRIILEAVDNGIGIENTDSLFLPFVSSKGKDGIGLGLAITRRIVENHGGSIHAENLPGGGAVFTVSLPHLVDKSL